MLVKIVFEYSLLICDSRMFGDNLIANQVRR